jgi:hypothetical protein
VTRQQRVAEDEAEQEQRLLSCLAPEDVRAGPIFILGAPRTGSTFLYQAITAAFELPFISNAINARDAKRPIVGLARQQDERPWSQISPQSQFGKAKGDLQPSEGSAVMMNWFGGGHPSELVSATILPGQLDHLRSTVLAAALIGNGPMVIKNAWNCFRVPAIAAALPQASFIWIRRDIVAAASSDLSARYTVQGNADSWNSATPRNIDELRKRPYWEQVVENQIAYGRALREAFATLPASHRIEVWHEDICLNPRHALERLATELPALLGRPVLRALDVLHDGGAPPLAAEDAARVMDYVKSQPDRMARERYRGASRT